MLVLSAIATKYMVEQLMWDVGEKREYKQKKNCEANFCCLLVFPYSDNNCICF